MGESGKTEATTLGLLQYNVPLIRLLLSKETVELCW